MSPRPTRARARRTPAPSSLPSWLSRWGTAIATSLAVFVLIIDVTAVNVALPGIQRSLGARFSDMGWVIDAYALGLASTVLVFGSLGDRFGRKRIFLAGLVLFGMASLGCGLTGTPLAMHVLRGLQGIGGAAMLSGSLSLIGATYDGRARDVALSVWGGATAVAIAVGPLIGGAILRVAGWEAIYFVNIPILALTVALTWRTMPESTVPRVGRKLDLSGLVAQSGAMLLLVWAVLRGGTEGWVSTPILACFAGAAALAALFIIIERRASDPLLDLALLRRTAMVGACSAMLAASASVFGIMTFVAMYFQNALGYDGLETGIRLLPMTAGAFLTSVLSARLLGRVPAAHLVGAGLLLAAAGSIACFVQVDAQTGWTALIAGGLCMGMCHGLVVPAAAHAALESAPTSRSGMASGLNNTCRQLGLALGVAVFGSIIHGSVRSALGPDAPAELVDRVAMGHTGAPSGADASVFRSAFVDGFDQMLVVSAAIALLGALVASFLLRVRADGPAPVAASVAETALARQPQRIATAAGITTRTLRRSTTHGD